MDKGFHHFHKRKRIHQKLEKYPSKNKWINLIDKLIYAVIASGIIITIPQVYKIWVEKNASGVSIVSWSGYLILSLFWLTYGFVHREKPIIVSNLLWIFLYIFIITGIAIYG